MAERKTLKGIVASATAMWMEKHDEKTITGRTNALLDCACESLILSALGIERGRWSSDPPYAVGHNNGCGTMASKALTEWATTAAKAWLDEHRAEITEEVSVAVVRAARAAYRDALGSQVLYQVRDAATAAAAVVARRVMDRLIDTEGADITDDELEKLFAPPEENESRGW